MQITQMHLDFIFDSIWLLQFTQCVFYGNSINV